MRFFRKKKKEFFNPEEKQRIVEAIRQSEKMTSGEVRVFVESKCRMVDALDRAIEIFYSLQMEKTEQRNAVLVYIAMKDRQLAVFGDKGIHEKTGSQYWHAEVNKILKDFNRHNYAEGIRKTVIDIGQVLNQYFPYYNDTDKNELPDDIVFGNE